MDNTFIQEKLLPRLTFNPGLALTPFRTTRPRKETETSATEPNLKDIHNILKCIQSAISDMQGTIATLVKENNKLSGDVADLRHIIAKNNDEVEKLKGDFIKQNQYVASLERKLECEKKASKQQRSDIQELRESVDELEQYSRKHSVEIHGIPVDIIGISTDEVVCKVASVVGAQIAPENIEISHRFYRRKAQNRSLPSFQITRTRQSYIKREFNSRI